MRQAFSLACLVNQHVQTEVRTLEYDRSFEHQLGSRLHRFLPSCHHGPFRLQMTSAMYTKTCSRRQSAHIVPSTRSGTSAFKLARTAPPANASQVPGTIESHVCTRRPEPPDMRFDVACTPYAVAVGRLLSAAWGGRTGARGQLSPRLRSLRATLWPRSVSNNGLAVMTTCVCRHVRNVRILRTLFLGKAYNRKVAFIQQVPPGGTVMVG